MLRTAPHTAVDDGAPARSRGRVRRRRVQAATAEELFGGNIDLARRLGSRKRREGSCDYLSHEELEQETLVALWQCAREYDAAVVKDSSSFRAFAWQRMKLRLIDESRRGDHMTRLQRREWRKISEADPRAELSAAQQRPSSLQERERSDGHADRTVQDLLVDASAGEAFETVDSQLTAAALLPAVWPTLSARQAQVLYMLAVEELTCQEVGELLGITSCRVWQIDRAAREGARGAASALAA